MEPNIRPDFECVKTQLTRLLVYSEQADAFNIKDWSHLKNQEDFMNVYGLEPELRIAYENIYGDGRDLAVWISRHFSSFNDVGTFPTLKSYVESFQGSWVYQIIELKAQIKQTRTLIEQNGSPWAVRQMVGLFESEIAMLEAALDVIGELKISDLYLRETKNNATTPKASIAQIATITGILEIFALVLWMLSELCKDKDQNNLQAILLWLAMAFFLAGAAHVAHKIIGKVKAVWTVYGAVCICLGFVVFHYTRPSSIKITLTKSEDLQFANNTIKSNTLVTLSNGTSRQKIESIFGIPNTESKLSTNFVVCSYGVEDVYRLITVYEDTALVAFSVTTQNHGFNPTFQVTEDRKITLGRDKFVSIFTGANPDEWEVSTMPKDFLYSETTYLGNERKYETCLLAYSQFEGAHNGFDTNAAYWLDGNISALGIDKEIKLTPDQIASYLKSFRKNSIPNIIGFSAIYLLGKKDSELGFDLNHVLIYSGDLKRWDSEKYFNEK